ncbi:hypothetical protein H0H93_010262 [Arthromyces matolae]|nr:hypothetical protein H0H93_010262 [Arthromyces matolae]
MRCQALNIGYFSREEDLLLQVPGQNSTSRFEESYAQQLALADTSGMMDAYLGAFPFPKLSLGQTSNHPRANLKRRLTVDGHGASESESPPAKHARREEKQQKNRIIPSISVSSSKSRRSTTPRAIIPSPSGNTKTNLSDRSRSEENVNLKSIRLREPHLPARAVEAKRVPQAASNFYPYFEKELVHANVQTLGGQDSKTRSSVVHPTIKNLCIQGAEGTPTVTAKQTIEVPHLVEGPTRLYSSHPAASASEAPDTVSRNQRDVLQISEPLEDLEPSAVLVPQWPPYSYASLVAFERYRSRFLDSTSSSSNPNPNPNPNPHPNPASNSKSKQSTAWAFTDKVDWVFKPVPYHDEVDDIRRGLGRTNN